MSAFWLSVRFLALFALLFPLFLAPPVRSLSGTLVARVGARALSACSDGSASGSEKDGRLRVTVRFRGTSRERFADVEKTLDYLRNIPLFWAVVVAAARVRRGRMLLLLFLGTMALVFLNGMVVASVAGEALAGVQEVPPLHLNAGYQLLAVLAVLHKTGGMFVAPVFLGALAAITLLGNPPPAPPSGTRRNDPCPCGSGRKFKRCCGR